MLRTPLNDLLALQEARFLDFDSWEVAGDFGDSRKEYDAVRADAGIRDLSHLGKVRVSGPDRRIHFFINIPQAWKTAGVGDLKVGLSACGDSRQGGLRRGRLPGRGGVSAVVLKMLPASLAPKPGSGR